MNNKKSYLIKQLKHWNKFENNRSMPWKAEKDPYRIWLSEIILQQTRVEQGWDYYLRFVTAFPTVGKLATAPEIKVYKMWEGLGYYTRCKNLISTAKQIQTQYAGKFPDKYHEILALKGVGPYTAAAIASFAYNQPCAVVDGNVFRVLSRFLGIETAIDSIAGKKLFTNLAHDLLDKKEPGIYNQALMDFGAVVCKPKSPGCPECPLNNKCTAYLNGLVDRLPFKEKKISNKKRWFYYLLVEYNGKVYVRKRKAKDIWQNLYEFILYEKDKKISVTSLNNFSFAQKMLGKTKQKNIEISYSFRQKLTHQTIEGRFIKVSIDKPLDTNDYTAVLYSRLTKLPFPKCIVTYLSSKGK